MNHSPAPQLSDYVPAPKSAEDLVDYKELTLVFGKSIKSWRGPTSSINDPENVVFKGKDYLFTLQQSGCVTAHEVFEKKSESGKKRPPGTSVFKLCPPDPGLYNPHDVSITKDGEYLAVANQGRDNVFIFKRQADGPFYDLKPVATILLDRYNLIEPHSVKFSPAENIMAVGYIFVNKVALFRFDSATGIPDPYPYQILYNSEDILVEPEGINFSTDGQYLAVTGHETHSVQIFQRIWNGNGRFIPYPIETLAGGNATNLKFPHSIAFHPSSGDLAVVNAGFGVNGRVINLYKKISSRPPMFDPIPSIIDLHDLIKRNPIDVWHEKALEDLGEDEEESGFKGVCFSGDGTMVALTMSDRLDLQGRVFISPVEVISSSSL
jgi:hypothetical protein